MTESACRVDSLSTAEPLAGTAPRASRLLIVEQPGPWGSAAVQDCRMNATVKAELEQLAETADIKVYLARRRDRRTLNGLRNTWFMHRNGGSVQAEHLQIPADASVSIPTGTSTSPTGSAGRESTMFVCTNGARDQCCAVAGRNLLKQLGSDAWEISHLGGHRFAPTALSFPDGLLFGRLDAISALAITAGRSSGVSNARGRFGRESWQQVAELAVAESTGRPLQDFDSSGGPGETTVSDSLGATWTVESTQRELEPRRVSCTAEPSVDHTWVPTVTRSDN